MLHTSALALVLFLPLALFAQPGDEPPLLDRPVDYSGIVGTGLTINVTVNPTELAVEDPFILTVAIRGSSSPQQPPRRKLLQLFPAHFEKNFFVEPLPERDRQMPATNTWEFYWRLRPKHLRVDRLPGLKLVYYHAGFRRYQTVYSASVPLKVSPRPVVQREEVQTPELLTAPALMSRLAEVELGPARSEIPWLVLVGLFLGPPLLCLAGGLIWHGWFPGAATVARRRRRRAARRALAALRRVQDDFRGEQVSAILAGYLRDRFGVQVMELTPIDLTGPLQQAGLAPTLQDQVQQLLREGARLRFAPPNGQPLEYRAQVERMIAAVERERCSPV